MKEIIEFHSISEAVQAMGIDEPKHPLVSVFYHKDIQGGPQFVGKRIISSFYIIEFKDGESGSIDYGRTTYDFQKGTLIFLAPRQVLDVDSWPDHQEEVRGWTLMFHPDLIRQTPLGESIGSYSFFSYESNEALHLSTQEVKIITDLRDKVVSEYNQDQDTQSHKLIVTSIELLLDYCTRYYNRQFESREIIHKDIITRFEDLIKSYYNSDRPKVEGTLTVKYCGEALNISPNYFSDMLKKETGKNTTEHIHDFVIDRAKTQLLSSNASINEIAYGLGFEYPQGFSKLFKKKTGVSPKKYRGVP